MGFNSGFKGLILTVAINSYHYILPHSSTHARTHTYSHGMKAEHLCNKPPQRKILAEKITVGQLAQKYLVFYGNRDFITGSPSSIPKIQT